MGYYGPIGCGVLGYKGLCIMGYQEYEVQLYLAALIDRRSDSEIRSPPVIAGILE